MRALELPVFDRVANDVDQSVQADKSSAQDLDPAIAGEVLRVANSSFFSGLGEISRLADAIVRLGSKQVASLALAASQKRMYSASNSQFSHRLVVLWRHANAVAFGSRWLAEQLALRHLTDVVFLAGVLHDVGTMSLLRNIEDLNCRLCSKMLLHLRLEDSAISRMHTQFNLPAPWPTERMR